MAAEKGPYQHTTETTGFGSEGETNPHQKEHRDTASRSAEGRNEIDPEERNREKDYGPRTHRDTRITSKEGTAGE